ncbi:MAG: hypothetical protein IKU37_00105 [Candidatus Gastranaerophilales bacterium]|nr:hypothetical protein [Candidatus Gastranaerophilales bacterium]
MRNLLIVFAIAWVGWYFQNNFDFDAWKQDTINVMSQEKTINTVNTKRAADQRDVTDVTNR